MFLGTGAYDKIIQAVEGSADLSACVLPDPNFLKLQKHDELILIGTTDAEAQFLEIYRGVHQ